MTSLPSKFSNGQDHLAKGMTPMTMDAKLSKSFLAAMFFAACIFAAFAWTHLALRGFSVPVLLPLVVGPIVGTIAFGRCLRRIQVSESEVRFEFYLGKPVSCSLATLRFPEPRIVHAGGRKVWLFLFSNADSLLCALGADKNKIQSALWATSSGEISKQNDRIVAMSLAAGLFINVLCLALPNHEGHPIPFWKIGIALAVAVLHSAALWLTLKRRH